MPAQHNWNATEITRCEGGGELTVTLNAWSLTPYTGASCGWSTHIQVLLYSVPISGINLANGCENLIQDCATNNTGAGYLATGSVFTFTDEVWVHGAGKYTFASMNGCDAGGPSTVTGFSDFTIDFP